MSTRVQIGKLPGGGSGLRVISADGSTVIIDGTSNMFKIAASGTIINTCNDAAATATTIELTGLGLMASPPAHVSFIAQGSAATSERNSAHSFLGWAPTGALIAPSAEGAITTRVESSGYASVRFNIYNESGGQVTWYGYFYIMQELAM